MGLATLETLEKVREEINKRNERDGPLFYLTVTKEETGTPTMLSVRFPSAIYEPKLFHLWEEISWGVVNSSSNAAFVTTGEELFRHGIMEIAINSSRKNFDYIFLVKMLEWLNDRISTFNPR